MPHAHTHTKSRFIETSRVKKNGYFFRQPYAAFLQRYKMLSAMTWPNWSGVAIEGVARLLRDLPISATEYAFGRRQLFIKNQHIVRINISYFSLHFL